MRGIELNDDFHVAREVNFAPDFQYFVRLSAQSTFEDGAGFGFKSHVTL